MEYSVKCDSCEHVWQVDQPSRSLPAPLCDDCGSAETKYVWTKMPGIPAERWDPYTLLDRPIPEEPKSYSAVTQKPERKKSDA